MKTAAYITVAALVLAGGVFYYFAASRNLDIQNQFSFSAGDEKSAAGGGSSPDGQKSSSSLPLIFAESGAAIQDFAGRTVEGTKNLFAEATGKAVSGLSDTAESAKDAARQTALNVLGVSSPINPADAQFKVCSVQKKDAAVAYLIENPFFPNEGAAYQVDWDDGAKAAGDLKGSEQNILISHLYAESGNFRAVFSVTAVSGTLVLERQICVQ